MATVTGFTAERMLPIENETVVNGEVVGSDLILVTREGTPINAGIVRGPKGDKGDPGEVEEAPADSVPYVRKDGLWVPGVEKTTVDALPKGTLARTLHSSNTTVGTSGAEEKLAAMDTTLVLTSTRKIKVTYRVYGAVSAGSSNAVMFVHIYRDSSEILRDVWRGLTATNTFSGGSSFEETLTAGTYIYSFWMSCAPGAYSKVVRGDLVPLMLLIEDLGAG